MQFTLYLGSILIGVGLAFAVITILKSFELLDNDWLRTVLASPLWYIFFLLMVIIVFLIGFLYTGDPLIYDGYVTELTMFNPINIIVFTLTTLFMFISTNVNYFRLQGNGIIPELTHAGRRAVPLAMVFFSFIVLYVNLPYFPRFFNLYARPHLYLSMTPIDHTVESGIAEIPWLSGLFVLSIFIIIPRLLISLLEVFDPEIQSTDKLNHVEPKQETAIPPWANIFLVVIGLIPIFFALYHIFLYRLYGGGTISPSSQYYLTPNLINPNFANIEAKDTPPNEIYRWGTDYLGRDIYSRTIFGFSFTMYITFLISIGRTILVFAFHGLRNIIPHSIHDKVRQVFTSIPRVLLLFIISAFVKIHVNAYTSSESTIFGFDLLLFMIVISLFFWGDSYEVLRSTNTNGSGFKPWFYAAMKVFLATMAMVMIEVIILTLLELSGGSLMLGSGLNAAKRNNPTRYTWSWQYPLMVIVVVYGIFSVISQLIYMKHHTQIRVSDKNNDLYPENENN